MSPSSKPHLTGTGNGVLPANLKASQGEVGRIVGIKRQKLTEIYNGYDGW